MSEATVNLLFDVRNKKASGKYPVKLTVYFLNSKKRYKTGIDLTQEGWNKINSSNLKDQMLKSAKLRLDALVSKASDIIDKLEEFSFEEFENEFFDSRQHLESNSFIKLFRDYIAALKKEERLGTAATYNTTLNSLLNIKANIRVNEITKSFLQRYEGLSRDKGHSETTIGINLRNIRTIVNVAIKEGYMKKDKYPFAGYSIPSGRNIKKSLTWENIQALLHFHPEDEKQEKALDLWKFSYLCNGMNIADIAQLQDCHISGDFLQFQRTKSKRTAKQRLPIRVALHPMAKEIIKKWKQSDNPYIFNIFQPGLSAVTQKNRIDRAIKKVNNNIQPVFKKLEISIGSTNRITTYAARHSFATTLKRKGVPTDEISEYLGHSSLTTTRAYLDSFEDTLLIERSKLLVE